VSQWEIHTSEGGGAKTAKEEAGKNKCDEEKERKILHPAYLFSTTSSLVMLALPSLCLLLTHPQRNLLSTSVNLNVADSSTLKMKAGHFCRALVNFYQTT
jgi:hypothetical protein